MATAAVTFPGNGGANTISVKAGQSFAVLLTVTNPGTVPVNVQAIQPRILATPNIQIASASGNPTVPASNTQVPASGSQTFQWQDVIYGPDLSNGLANDLSPAAVSVDAVVFVSDGTQAIATAGTVTVTARTF